jgi:hypothetical protein
MSWMGRIKSIQFFVATWMKGSYIAWWSDYGTGKQIHMTAGPTLL